MQKNYLFFLFLLSFAHVSFSQTYSLDPHFKSPVVKSSSGQASVLVRQADGKTILEGLFHFINNRVANYLVRLNSDGSTDTTFHTGTGFDGLTNAIAIQQDGKILVSGRFTTYNDRPHDGLIRLNQDGSVDTTFKSGLEANPSIAAPGIMSLALQRDGKILVGCLSSSKILYRLNPDGSIDNSFNFQIYKGVGGGQYVDLLSLQSDGKILIGGFFLPTNNNLTRSFARLHKDGSLDTNFTGFAAHKHLYALCLQVDDKILLSLDSVAAPNNQVKGHIIRLYADGTNETNFNSPLADRPIEVVSLQNDGKILMGGGFDTVNTLPINRIARLHTDGSIDDTFNAGKVEYGSVHTILQEDDEQITFGGEFNMVNGKSRKNIVRVNPDGSLDDSYTTTLETNGRTDQIVIQPDKKILIAGHFNTVHERSMNNIARLQADGSLDTSFTIGKGFESLGLASVSSVALQSDGRILLAGTFRTFDGKANANLARLNANGTLDPTFNIGTGFNNAVMAVAPQKDGKILAGGWFTNFNGTSVNRLVRLNADGSLDTGFNLGSGFDDAVYAIVVQPDERILVGGWFNSFNGTSKIRIARLHPTGLLDNTFTAKGPDDFTQLVTSILLQPDGKMLANGSFTTFNNASYKNLIRLNANGSTDNTFRRYNKDLSIGKVILQPDGKLLGIYTTYTADKSLNSTIDRMNPSGSLDSTFHVASGTFKSINSIALQAEDKLLVFTAPMLSRYAIFQSQSIVFPSVADKTFGDPSFPLKATASSGLPVSYAVISGPASISNDTLTLTGAGKVTIQALQPGNENYTAASSVEQTFCVLPAKPAITTTGSDTSATLLLTSSSPTGNQWLRNGQVIEGAVDQVYAVTQAGSYTVRITIDGCVNIADADPVALTGEEAELNKAFIKLYPNPASSQLILHLMDSNQKEAKVQIFNPQGVLVDELFIKGKNYNTAQGILINVTKLPQGRYILFVTEGKKYYSNPFIKQ